jgi:hypothetical protein
MKHHPTYPKVIIHHLGPVPQTRRNPWLLRVLSLTVLFLMAGVLHAGTHTWSGAGTNTLWSNAANWSAGRDVQLIFLGTGTPGPEITGITKVGNSVSISVSWLPAMAGTRVNIQIGSISNPLTSWGNRGSVILDAKGNGTYTYNEFQSKAFFRFVVN